MALTIRTERPGDFRAVEQLTREAFWNHHVPGCDEHHYLHNLRFAPCFLPQLSQVALLDGRLAGHIAYHRAHIALDKGGTMDVLCFGPVSVLPQYQNRGVGAALIRTTLAMARHMGHGAALIYGDVCYYARFGFHMAERHLIRDHAGFWMGALLALELAPGALAYAAGRFHEGDVPMDPAGFDAYDATFPPKAKGTSPYQARFAVLSSLQYREGTFSQEEPHVT